MAVVSQGYDFVRLAIAASQGDVSPGYAPKGDLIDKSMARQEHDKSMARAWQEQGKNMAGTWHEHDKSRARTRQEHGMAMLVSILTWWY
jgi:hypothetical protein